LSRHLAKNPKMALAPAADPSTWTEKFVMTLTDVEMHTSGYFCVNLRDPEDVIERYWGNYNMIAGALKFYKKRPRDRMKQAMQEAAFHQQGHKGLRHVFLALQHEVVAAEAWDPLAKDALMEKHLDMVAQILLRGRVLPSPPTYAGEVLTLERAEKKAAMARQETVQPAAAPKTAAAPPAAAAAVVGKGKGKRKDKDSVQPRTQIGHRAMLKQHGQQPGLLQSLQLEQQHLLLLPLVWSSATSSSRMHRALLETAA